jgi:hypothetical protein
VTAGTSGKEISIMMRTSRLLGLGLAVALAVGTLGCGDSNPRSGPIPAEPIRGEATVTVSAGATTFYGIDVTLTFDNSFMSVAAAAVAGDLTDGGICEASSTASTMTLGCADDEPMVGAGSVGIFVLDYEDFVPDAGDFSVDCDFFDELGGMIAGDCTLAVSTS